MSCPRPLNRQHNTLGRFNMEIRKILFAADFSEGSSSSLPYAVDFAKRYGAKLYLVHVLFDI